MPLNLARLAAAFSLRRNLRLLLVPHPGAVPAVTGFRALGMMWVIVQHVQQGLRPLGFTLPGALFLAHPVLSVGWAGNLAIESFFVISGYLIWGILMSEREANGSISFGSYYARRALRILPIYFLAIGVNLAFTTKNTDAAWANVLYVNNFLPFTKQFMAHCWSLAIEEQFFTTSPLLVLLVCRARASLRTPLLGAAVLAACAISLAVVMRNDVELSLRFPNPVRFWQYMDVFYTKPHTRFGSIVMGILVAQLEREGRLQAVLERRRHLTAAIAALAVASMVTLIFVFPEGREPSGERRLLGALQIAFGGYIFGAGAAYLLFVTRTQHWLGRALARVLGNRLLHSFSQLSYAIFLFHPICITPLFGWLGFDLARPWMSYGRILASSFAVSTAAALVIFLVVELPIMHLRPRARGHAGGGPEARARAQGVG